MIVLQDRIVDAEAIEAALARRVGRAVVLQPFAGELVVLAEADALEDPAAAARRVRRAVADAQPVVADDVVFVAAGTLPADADRAELLERLRHGGLRIAHRDRLTPDPPPLAVGAVTAEREGLTPTEVRQAVADVLGFEPDELDDGDDLAELGLDSIRVMKLVNDWREAGYEVSFAQLAERPTLEQWQALLQTARSARDAAPEVDEGEPFDLTPVQHAYWIGRREGQPLGGVGCHFYLELDGEGLDADALEAAVHRLTARHGLLRAEFLDDGRQRIRAQAGWPGLTVHDLGEDAGARLLELRERLSHRRLDVDRGEVFDVQLSRLPEGRHRLHFNFDLLVADVRSIQLFLEDLAALFGGDELPDLEGSFPGYLAALEARRAESRGEAMAYWRERLPELPGGPELPLAADPAQLGTPRFTRREHRLSAAGWDRLAQRARRHGVTPAMALATAYAEALGAWSAEPRFLLNLPLFDRQHLVPGAERMVADFTNLTLVEADVSDPASFAERARRVQASFREHAAHSDYSGVEVLRDLARTRSGAGPSVAAPVVFTSALGMGGLIPEPVQARLGRVGWMLSQTPQVWLDHQVVELDGGVLLNWDAVDGLFPEGVLDAMFGAYVGLLEWLAAADWEQPVPALLPAGQRAVREQVNATQAPAPREALHDAFFARAAEDGGRVAVLAGDEHVSYGELSERALRIAGGLRERGVGRGEVVAVTLPKGPGQLAAVLGVLAAGAAYVPVGVEQPQARRERIYERAGTALVIDERGLAGLAGHAPLLGPVAQDPDGLGYVIFTSGSTGEPKGVEITHAAALNTIADVNRRIALGPDDRVLAVSALDFDLSVYDVFAPLAVGAAIVLIAEEERREARRWRELIGEHGVTVWNSVPALLDMLLTATEPEALPGSLRVALLSGDWIGLDLPGRLRAAAPGCRLLALGGATEAAIWSNVFAVEEVDPAWASIPYGRPLANQRYRVVDARGQDCPDWVTGELWIGGEGVARGYRHDPEQTRERFVTDDGERWYRTGDQGRYWPDGTLEFQGRTDHQIKLRGHRIELGEITAALTSHPGIAQAAAATLGRPARRLGAVVVGDDADRDELRRWAANRLPDYMVPDVIVRADALPLSANGKVDRAAVQALLEGEGGAPVAAEPPREGVETLVGTVWSEVLGVNEVGRGQSFFELGGDSLLATRLIARLGAEGVEGAELGSLFERPVLADFAATLRLAGGERQQRALVADVEHRHEPFPPTDVQRAYWMGRTDDFALGGVGCHFYTELDGEGVDLARLEEAINRLVAHHEMLRAVFLADGSQRILPRVDRFRLPVTDAPVDAPDAALAELRSAMSHQLIDATRWPLFDLRAVRYGERARIGVSLDNIILDALSAMTFFDELEQLYADLDAELPPVGVSFRDYVEQVEPDPQALESAQAYWRERLDDLPPAPDLPLRTDPAKLGRPTFTRREAHVDAERWQAISERARAHGLTASSVLATAFCEVLSAWSTHAALTVNLTLFDRRDVHPDIGNVMGDFTSLLLLAYQPQPGESWAASARRLQEQVGRDLQHSEASAIWVMRELARRRGSADVAMPVVLTSTLGVGREEHSAPPFAERVWGISQTPQVWLDHQVVELDGGVLLNWDAVDGLFPEGVLDAMFGAYVGLLEWLAAADWEQPVPALLPAGQRAVREQVNATQAPAPREALHDAFFARAAEDGGRVAVLAGDEHVSYGELSERALRIAGGLRERGVGRGEVVAVTLPKGPGQLAAVLGVLAAGAAYVPVGVEQPQARRERIYERAGTALVIDERGLAGLAGHAPLLGPVAQDPDGLGYVIFTSGSTGEPKGVEITHAAALNTIADVNRRIALGPDDRVLAVSALDFDLSVYDVFAPLAVGAAIVLIAEEERREARRWRELIGEHGVTVWNSVPALLDMLLTATEPEAPPGSLRVALLSGDWIGLDLPGRLRAAAPGCRLLALGGATEAAIWSNVFAVEEVDPAWASIPYGRPLANQRYRVVDARGQDCPDWVTGELWIGGEGVARGYRHDLEQTRERFVTDDGERWYRTGDQGRYWPDGTLEFQGRTDHQIKLRGHRIELGEITAALTSHPDIAQATTATTGERETLRLVSFVVPADGALNTEALAGHLRERLPDYAVPKEFITVERLPLTANGKLDRDALDGLAEPSRDESGDEPQDECEQRLAQAWAEVLEVPRVGRHDNFVVLGGDSLLATRLVELLERRFGWTVSLRQLFRAETVAGLARELPGADGSLHTEAIEEGVI